MLLQSDQNSCYRLLNIRGLMKNKIVLLADSHPALLEGMRGLLATVFKTVVMVSDEDSLMEVLPKLEPDLVVVDMSLPVAQQPNVVMLLNKYDFELKIIALSTNEEPELMKHAMSSGASGYLLKRSAARDLFKAVEKVLRGGTFVTSDIGPPT